MSDDDKLLTRRQILGLFGASTGAAIVGTGAANLESGDGQGNLYGGVAEMAEPHKIGENMWKGPLSVRSDIPKQDGNDFIQTDAGPSNNQYAMHHYNGGWSKQGLDARLLSADEGHIGDYHVPPADADLATFVSDHAGGKIHLVGQTFEVSSVWSPPDDTTIKGGVVKLADNADSDLFYRADPSNLVLEDIRFDFNGANNTGQPTNEAYWKIDQTVTGGGDGTEVRHCRFVNGSGRGSQGTLHWVAHGHNIKIDTCRWKLGGGANIKFFSKQQMQVINPFIEGIYRVLWQGEDAVVSGGQIIESDVGVMLVYSDGQHVGDYTFDGVIIEDNNKNIYLDSQLKEHNHVKFDGCQIQGALDYGIEVTSNGATVGELVVSDTDFKRNQFETGSGSHINLAGGEAIILRDVNLTNNSTADAVNGIAIGSGATDVELAGVTADASDFSGSVISDAGTRTRVNDVVELGAAPSASNYDEGDAGLTLIDTSSTADPYDRYTVLQDGTLDGPY